jgi:hypothetical protein
MSLHVSVFLFMVCLLLLALLWRLDWFALRPSSSPGGAKCSRFPRRLKSAAQMIARPVVWPLLPRRVESLHLCVPGVK